MQDPVFLLMFATTFLAVSYMDTADPASVLFSEGKPTGWNLCLRLFLLIGLLFGLIASIETNALGFGSITLALKLASIAVAILILLTSVEIARRAAITVSKAVVFAARTLWSALPQVRRRRRRHRAMNGRAMDGRLSEAERA